jgi:solute carrier family 25 phosphate transporter 23/24/25/41
MPGRLANVSQGPPQLAVVYGASTAWPLAHLPNPASHGPAAAALGDSLKAEHQRLQPADGDGVRALKLLLAGGLAGALSRTATAPMDRLRMLQQVHRGSGVLSMRQGLAKMASEGTVRAFWRGNGTNVAKNIPEMGLKLCAADHARQAISADGTRPTLAQRLAIGGLAGAIAQATVFPLEVVQTRLAVSPVGTYSGIWDALSKIVAQEGPRALYRGLTPTMCGILPYAGIDIAVFGMLRDHMTDAATRRADAEAVAAAAAGAGHPECAAASEEMDARMRAQSPLPRETTPGEVQPAAGGLLVAGMVSSTSAQLVSYPLGLVRTRLQAQGMGGRPVVYRGMLDCFRQILRHEGVRGLYKGLLPDMAKIAPAAAICWTVFERGKSWLGVHETPTRPAA